MSTIYNWKNGTNGDWSTATDWSGGAVPNSSAADVGIAGAGSTVTVAYGESFTADSVTVGAGATLAIQGFLNLSGPSDRLLVNSGALDLGSLGTIAGGTIVASAAAPAGGITLASGGTLQDVTCQGNLNITENYGTVNIVGKFAVENAQGNGPGIINISGNLEILKFQDGQTLDNVGINLGIAGQASRDSIIFASYASTTLGSHATLNSNGIYANRINSSNQRSIFMNDGVINVAGQGLGIFVGTFVNSGILSLSNGYLATDNVVFSNKGLIDIKSGSDLILNAASVTGASGTIDVGGTLNIFDGVTLASLGHVSLASSGLLNIAGSLDLGGHTLGVAGANNIMLGGTVANGTINPSSVKLDILNNATLQDITYRGNFDIASAYIDINIIGNLNVLGTNAGSIGTINLIGNNDILSIQGNHTFDNVGINLGMAGQNSGDRLYSNNGYTQLVFGKHAVVTSNGMSSNIIYGAFGSTITNLGIINVAGAGLEIGVYDTTFTNIGTINVSTASTLTVSPNNFTNAGVINVAGGADLILSFNTVGAIGNIIMANTSTLDIAGNLSLTTVETIVGDHKVVLDVTGPGTLDLSGGTLSVGSNTQFSTVVVEAATLYNGFITMGDGGTLILNDATLSAITYSGTLNVSGMSNSLYIKNGLTANGGVINLTDPVNGGNSLHFLDSETLNSQTIVVGNSTNQSGGSIYEQFGTLTLGINTEILQASTSINGGTIYGNVVNEGLIFVAAAQFGISAIFNNQTGQYDGSFINAKSGTIAIGNNASVSASDTTFENAGLVTAANGGLFYTSSEMFTNIGTIDIGRGAGYLDGSQTFDNAGLITVATGGTLTLASVDFVNTGKITLAKNSLLEISQSMSLGVLSSLVNGGGVLIDISQLGTLDLGTGTLDINTGGEFAYVLVSDGTLANGAIKTDGGTLELINATLDAITYSGTLNVGGNYNNLYVENGLTATGGTINLTDPSAGGESLQFMDGETLSNQTIVVGESSTYPGGSIYDQYGTLTLGATTEILQAATTTQGGYIYGNIVNDGLLSVAAGPFNIAGAYDYVTNQYDDSFVNAATGTIAIGHGALLSVTTPTFDNAGLLQTNGGTISIAPANFTNMANGTLTGGIYDIEAGGTLLLPHLITTDAANIILSGAGSVIESGTTTIEISLTSIASTGTLQILGNRGYNASKPITDSGSLALGGGTFAPALTINGTGQVSGYGKFSAPITDNSLITATQSTLTLAGALSGTGGVFIDAGATLVLGASAASTNQIIFGGTGADLVLNAPGSIASTFVSLAASDTIDIAGTLVSTATISGNALLVSLTAGGTLSYALTKPTGPDRVATSSDGHGGTNLVVYNEATAAAVAPVNFGIVHVGKAASDVIVISNNAAPGAYSENLDGSFSGTSTGFTGTGSLNGLAAGSTSSNGLSIGLNTSKAGIFSGTTTLGLASDGAGIDTLGTTALGSDIINLIGTVNNYATVGVSLISGPGKLSVNGPTTLSLNLGAVAQGSTGPAETIGIVNAAHGPADLLSGSLSLSGTTGAFIDNSAISFSGIGAGSVSTGHTISLKTNNIGTFSETIVLHPTGSNASGYAGTLAAETFIVTGTVTAAAAVTSPGPMRFIAPAGSATPAANAPLTGIAAWTRIPALASAPTTPPPPLPAAPASTATASPAGILTPYSPWLAQTAALAGVVNHPASHAW